MLTWSAWAGLALEAPVFCTAAMRPALNPSTVSCGCRSTSPISRLRKPDPVCLQAPSRAQNSCRQLQDVPQVTASLGSAHSLHCPCTRWLCEEWEGTGIPAVKPTCPWHVTCNETLLFSTAMSMANN